MHNGEVHLSSGRRNVLFPVFNFSSFTDMKDDSKSSSKYLSTISYKYKVKCKASLNCVVAVLRLQNEIASFSNINA